MTATDKVLNVEAVKALADQGDDDYLQQFTVIEDDAAAKLAKADIGFLELDGLRRLSAVAAASLAATRYNDILSLGGLTELPGDVAEALAKYDGELRLNGLKELSDAAAEALSRQPGELLLEGVTTLSAAGAAALGRREKPVKLGEHLAELADPPPGIAFLLARVEGSLRFDNLTTLSDALADALCTHEGALHLPSVTSLSPAAAASLARVKGDLKLSGLTSLASDVAEALAEHTNGCLILSGLTSLSDEAAEAIARHRGGDGFDGMIILDGLSSLSDAAAAALSRAQGHLSLGGVPSLSDVAIEALARRKDGLSLDGLEEISPEGAALLAQSQGFAIDSLINDEVREAVESAKASDHEDHEDHESNEDDDEEDDEKPTVESILALVKDTPKDEIQSLPRPGAEDAHETAAKAAHEVVEEDRQAALKCLLLAYAWAQTGMDYYIVACDCALLDFGDMAITILTALADAEYTYEGISTDADFESIHGDPRWESLCARIAAEERADDEA